MKSLFNKDKIKPRDKVDLYKLAHQTVLNEAHILWQSSNIFLVANTLLAAFIGSGLLDPEKNIIYKPNPSLFLLSIIGLFISVLWWGSYRRTSNYYKFRMAQATQREPEGWNLFDGDGKNFANGDMVEIGTEKYNLGAGKIFRNHRVVTALAILFIVLYLIVLMITSPLGIHVRY